MLLTSEGLRESCAEKGAILWLPLLRRGQVLRERGRALLQSTRATEAAKWHITRFLLLNIFETGLCSTKVGDPVAQLEG